MNPVWILAFAVAGSVTLIATPLLRRLALAIDLVDRPSARKLHVAPIPYLGGVAIAFGVLAGMALTPALGYDYAVVALSAAVLCAVGLVDDDRQLPAAPRLGVQFLAALAALAVGFRLEMTGVAAIDATLTLLWIVGLTNALNLLDNMDGLAAGVAASMATCAFLLASVQGLVPPATLALAAAGACLAFLVFNKGPASVFMGDAGSLFLGYLLAVTLLAAARPLGASAGFVVPLMLAAVPITDTTVVVVARLRHGISIAQGGQDHLSHRLARRGLPVGAVAALLAGLTLAIGCLGASAGEGLLPLQAAVPIGAVLLGCLLIVALRVDVYRTPAIGLSHRLRLVGGLGMVGALVSFSTGVAPIGADSAMVRPSRAVAAIDSSPEGSPTTEGRLLAGARLTGAPLGVLGVGSVGLGATLAAVVWQRRKGLEIVLPVDVRERQLDRRARA